MSGPDTSTTKEASSDNLGPTNSMAERGNLSPVQSLVKNPRQEVPDSDFCRDLNSEPEAYRNTRYIRVNAIGKRFERVDFSNCVFDSCYFRKCVFDTCNFTGTKFINANFPQATFTGCNFRYATFEKTYIDDDIMEREAPIEDNLKMRFSRSLRVNFQQIGDAPAVNRAILLELEATRSYLYNSWSFSASSYYRNKYTGHKRIQQALKWAQFVTLDFIWGNGESLTRLVRTVALWLLCIATIDAFNKNQNPNFTGFLESTIRAPGIFLGVVDSGTPVFCISVIAASRLLMVAMFTTMLIKRLSRR